jgi:hypothetical protein
MQPCKGHDPFVISISKGDYYEIPEGINARYFLDFNRHLETLTDDKIYEAITRLNARITAPDCIARLDNETSTPNSPFYSLQVQRNNNALQYANIKTTFAHVEVSLELCSLPFQITETNMKMPCTNCRAKVVSLFKQALSDSFKATLEHHTDDHKKPMGQTFQLVNQVNTISYVEENWNPKQLTNTLIIENPKRKKTCENTPPERHKSEPKRKKRK